MIDRFSLRRELVVAEHRHALRAGQHRGVDLQVGRVVQRRRGLAGGQRRALDVVPWQDAQLSRNSSPPCAIDVAVAAQLAGRDAGPPPIDCDVGRQLLGLLLVELRLLARLLGALAGGRHAAGADLEVDGRAADADQRTGPGPVTPCRFAPWQVMQLIWYSCRPAAMSSALVAVSVAPEVRGERGVGAAHATTSAPSRTPSRRAGGAAAARRAAVRASRRGGRCTGGRDGRLEAELAFDVEVVLVHECPFDRFVRPVEPLIG